MVPEWMEKQQRSDVQLSGNLNIMGSNCVMWTPWKPSDYHSTIVLRGLRGAFNYAERCQYLADVIFPSLEIQF